jgi:DNA polymerase I
VRQEKDTIYFVDGSAYIHRAYHAVRNLSNSKGFPTNAVFGFTKMILKLLSDRASDYVGIVFDARGPTFRHEMYEKYKANRPPMPEDMAVQVPVIKDVVQNLGLKTMEISGYEADDVIGTLARMAEERGFEVVMVTGDKDFRQLISPNAAMWDPMKDLVTDYDGITSAYGFDPVRFIDVMGLSGDASDNIPGVPGVGEKTAIHLIQQFGSFEGVFEHLDEITKKKLKENLENSKDDALLSKQLVTIDRFVPVSEDVDAFRVARPSADGLSQIFRDLEFRDLLNQFSTRAEETHEYRLCLTAADLKALTARIEAEGMVALDTETTGTDPMAAGLVGLSFCCKTGEAVYIPLTHQYLGVPDQLKWSDVAACLRPILEDDAVLKVGQNIKYDAEVLSRHGIKLNGIAFDTMIASYVINPGLVQHNLDVLAQQYLSHKMITYKEVVGTGRSQRGFQEVDIERACEYSCEDADMTWRLRECLDKRLKEQESESLFYGLEMKLVPVLMDMEMTGVKIDTEIFSRMSTRFGRELKNIEQEIFKEAGMEFNVNSPQQLGYVLFEKLGLPGQKRTAKTKRYSTDVRVLRKLSAEAYEIPRLLLRYRSISKLKSTYLDALIKMVDPHTGRLHTSYNQTVAATGRLSSSNPNLQNIPIRSEEGRAIRKGFVAEPGHLLVSADYSQIELRVFAHYSGDEAFIEAFLKDEDIHHRTAAEVVAGPGEAVTPDMRRIAKAINFGIIYGMGPRKLSEELGIDHKTAKAYIEAYYERYQGVARYRDQMAETAREKGYVTTLFNRRRYLSDIEHSNNRIRAEAERMAINTPIQGTAADLIKKAMINIHDRLKREAFRSKMLLQVHDELVFETPEDELNALKDMVVREMEGVYPLRVPLKVDISEGGSWDEAH